MNLPIGWARVPLGRVAKISVGGTPSRARPEYWGGSIPWVGTGAINFGWIERAEEFITDAGLRSSSARVFPQGTILVAMFGQGATRGRVARLGIDAAFNQACAAIVPNDEAMADFLYLQLAHRYQDLRSIANSGSQANLNAGLVSGFELVIPPPSEWGGISRIGLQYLRAAGATERLLVAKGRRKRGLMQALLSGASRLPSFGRLEWREHRLGEVFLERAETGRDDLPLLSITGERGVVPRDQVDRRDTSAADKGAYLRIAPGDIGYNTMRMWQGVSALSGLEGIVSPAYTICIPGPEVDGRFASYLFKLPSVVHRFRRFSQGLVDDTLNLKFHHFAQIRLRFPPIEEQRAIAGILVALDREMALLERQRDLLALQGQAVTGKLLSGGVRVPSNGSPKAIPA